MVAGKEMAAVDIQCVSPVVSSVRLTDRRCGNSNAAMVEIGYEVSGHKCENLTSSMLTMCMCGILCTCCVWKKRSHIITHAFCGFIHDLVIISTGMTM